jgi:hypothetical protein
MSANDLADAEKDKKQAEEHISGWVIGDHTGIDPYLLALFSLYPIG